MIEINKSMCENCKCNNCEINMQVETGCATTVQKCNLNCVICEQVEQLVCAGCVIKDGVNSGQQL
jgi:hypothetical protein